MIYVDTDFFLALLKEGDRLQGGARRLFRRYRWNLWTSPATLMELLMLAGRYNLDPEKLITAALDMVELGGGEAKVYYLGARYMKKHQMTAFDALHAAFCGKDCKIISSDKVFDKLGMERLKLEAA